MFVVFLFYFFYSYFFLKKIRRVMKIYLKIRPLELNSTVSFVPGSVRCSSACAMIFNYSSRGLCMLRIQPSIHTHVLCTSVYTWFALLLIISMTLFDTRVQFWIHLLNCAVILMKCVLVNVCLFVCNDFRWDLSHFKFPRT